MTRQAVALLPFVLALGLASALAPAPSQQAAEPPFGWYAAFEDPAGVVVETHATSAAFALEPEQAIHPRIAPEGAWEAHYLGTLGLQESGRYRFAVEVEGGEAHLWIEADGAAEAGPLDRFSSGAGGGATLTEGAWLDVRAIDLRIGVRFVRSGSGRARLRLLWEMEIADRKGFTREPVLTRAVRVPAELADKAAQGLEERSGFVLLERKRCGACHDSGGAVGVPPAPDLSDLGSRAPGPWIARWMANPAKMRPGADMPAVVTRPHQPSLIAGYLSALQAEGGAGDGPRYDIENSDVSWTELAEDASSERGRALYHRVGCVACHGALESQAALHGDDFLARDLPTDVLYPLDGQSGKWNVPALARFLEDPTRVHTDGRMPTLFLDGTECADLATYLVEQWGAGTPRPPAEISERGRVAFMSAGCNACHDTGEELRAARPAKPMRALDPARGCLDPNDADTPRYDLDDEERARLRLALATFSTTSDVHPAPLERAERRLELAGCYACHARAGFGGPDELSRNYFATTADDVDLGDEGRIPPDLTGIGFKLTGTWLREILQGDRRSRPYMATRMPHFGADVTAELAQDLARLEGLWPESPGPEPKASVDAAADGRSVLGRDALGCVACHVYRDFPPAGSPGLDVTGFAERLRYEWFRAFLQDPARYEPGTRMPAFGQGGLSTLTRLYDGDLLAQVDAMWAYFSLGESMLPPEGLESASELQLEVLERPVVLRTFLEGAGSRAIAVGHPSGVHVAYDAERCRTAQVWSGLFLDAAGAWAGRGGTPAGGRGELLWESSDSRPALEGSDAAPRFRGYALDEAGAPTFRFTLDEVSVFESYETTVLPAVQVRRTLVVEGGAGRALVLPAGPNETLGRATGGRAERDEASGTWRLEPALDRMEVVLEVQP